MYQVIYLIFINKMLTDAKLSKLCINKIQTKAEDDEFKKNQQTITHMTVNLKFVFVILS